MGGINGKREEEGGRERKREEERGRERTREEEREINREIEIQRKRERDFASLITICSYSWVIFAGKNFHNIEGFKGESTNENIMDAWQW